jgi:hypothetical protein
MWAAMGQHRKPARHIRLWSSSCSPIAVTLPTSGYDPKYSMAYAMSCCVWAIHSTSSVSRCSIRYRASSSALHELRLFATV